MQDYVNGGFAYIDCGGMNLLADSSQTITGLYNKVKAAYEGQKIIVATNCVYGTGVPMTPIPVFAIKESGNFICTASILQITVESDDSVTITPLVSGSAKKGGTK